MADQEQLPAKGEDRPAGGAAAADLDVADLPPRQAATPADRPGPADSQRAPADGEPGPVDREPGPVDLEPGPADGHLRPAADRDTLVRGLLGGVPVTMVAGLFAVWADRWYVPSALTRLAYPAALTLACFGTVAWTRRTARGRSTAELELTVVLLSVAAAAAALTLLAVAAR